MSKYEFCSVFHSSDRILKTFRSTIQELDAFWLIQSRELVSLALRDPHFLLQGVPPTHEHLRIKGVPRNSADVETFFTPHTLHPLQ
jgi:hypothetical protein